MGLAGPRRLEAEFGGDAVHLFLKPASALGTVEVREVVSGDVRVNRQTMVRKRVKDRRDHNGVANARWIGEPRRRDGVFRLGRVGDPRAPVPLPRGAP